MYDECSYEAILKFIQLIYLTYNKIYDTIKIQKGTTSVVPYFLNSY